jgi:hypothetical protein
MGDGRAQRWRNWQFWIGLGVCNRQGTVELLRTLAVRQPLPSDVAPALQRMLIKGWVKAKWGIAGRDITSLQRGAANN